MPGDQKHHTDKWRRCVEDVVAKGHDKSSAAAICTTSLQNAGEAIFEGAEARSDEEIRLLGDYEGHPFHGNQYSGGSGKSEKDKHPATKSAEHASKQADKASEAANARANFDKDNQARADLQSDAAVAHGKAADAHAAAAKQVKDPVDRDYHNQMAAGHHQRANAHAHSAGIFATVGDYPRSKVNENKAENVIKSVHKLFRRNEDGSETTMDTRELHLCGATGTVRYETLNGRKHMVVPIIALMEGVIHPVNAQTPEFVPAATLERAAASWVGKPVVLGHPVNAAGKQCSANAPEIMASSGMGVIMTSKFQGRKLLQEAWIDDEKAKKTHPEMHRLLEENRPVEVSVGAFVVTDQTHGDFNGKQYRAQWLAAQGDHLALLPGGRGACSCEMGCGTHRAAMHFVAAESIELMPAIPAEVFRALEEWVLATCKMVECETCGGLGQVKDGAKQSDCPICGGEGKMKAAAGARHSAADMKMIQTMHDHSIALGATCDRKNLETAAAGPTIKHEGGRYVIIASDGVRKLAEYAALKDAEDHKAALIQVLAKRAS